MFCCFPNVHSTRFYFKHKSHIWCYSNIEQRASVWTLKCWCLCLYGYVMQYSNRIIKYCWMSSNWCHSPPWSVRCSQHTDWSNVTTAMHYTVEYSTNMQIYYYTNVHIRIYKLLRHTWISIVYRSAHISPMRGNTTKIFNANLLSIFLYG